MKALVIGDSFLDIYLNGLVERISPEAPIPILNKTSIIYKPGGAANVACNLASLGITTTLITILGKDEDGERLENLVRNKDIDIRFIQSTKCPTITKTRFLSNGHQLLRTDNEIPFTNLEANELFFLTKELVKSFDYLILSDYDKGSLNEFDNKDLLAINPKLKIFLDPKKYNKRLFKNAFLIKPNLKEFNYLINQEFVNLNNSKNLIKKFILDFDCQNLLLTLGAKGMIIASRNENDNDLNIKHFDSEAKDVFDVTGAGDSVIAAFTASIIYGNSIIQSASNSNKAASAAVSNIGTYIVEKKDLNLDLDNRIIIFTNGCFDLIHLGHIKLFEFCKSLNGKVIVGLNSDKSIKKIKGESRPIKNQETRKIILESISYIDEVIIFDEETPLELLKQIKPNILVKGGDYKAEDIVGYKYLKEIGGRIEIFPFIEGNSSSILIQKANKKNI